MAIYRESVVTEFGRFVIEANEIGISRIIFPQNAARLHDTPDTSETIQKAAKELTNYFSGKSYDFSKLTYDFSEVSEFQEKVLRALLKIPQKTFSYSELGEMAGNPQASRAVGTAMNKNPFPVLIPCHRIIQTGGALGNYAYGIAWKKRLLEHEKIATATASSF